MSVDELLMLNHDDIDYHGSPDDLLQALALEVDPFIATSALAELSLRRSDLAADTAGAILTRPAEDRYLRATALEVLFSRDRDRAIAYMNAELSRSEPALLTTMMEIVLENRDAFVDEPRGRLARGVVEHLRALPAGSPGLDRETTERFLQAYGSDLAAEGDKTPAGISSISDSSNGAVQAADDVTGSGD